MGKWVPHLVTRDPYTIFHIIFDREVKYFKFYTPVMLEINWGPMFSSGQQQADMMMMVMIILRVKFVLETQYNITFKIYCAFIHQCLWQYI